MSFIPFSELVKGDIFCFHPHLYVDDVPQGNKCIKLDGPMFSILSESFNEDMQILMLDEYEIHQTRVAVVKESTEPITTEDL